VTDGFEKRAVRVGSGSGQILVGRGAGQTSNRDNARRKPLTLGPAALLFHVGNCLPLEAAFALLN
jgi:hypothetical protein